MIAVEKDNPTTDTDLRSMLRKVPTTTAATHSRYVHQSGLPGSPPTTPVNMAAKTRT